MALGLFRCPDPSQGLLVNFCPILTVKLKAFKIKANPKSHIWLMVYIICILPYKYYMGMMYILWLCIWIFEFILVWGEVRLGSLLLRIEPRGLYPWDIFSCPMGVSIIDIKVCTFSIGVKLLYDFFYWFHGYSLFGGAYLLFLPRFYLLRLSGNFPSILRIMASM